MHTNSLQVLLMLVAQVTSGSEGSKEDYDPPALFAPPIQSLPDDVAEPPASPTQPANRASQFAPSEFSPTKNDATQEDKFQGQPLPAANQAGQPAGNFQGGRFPIQPAPVEPAPREAAPAAAASSVLERSPAPELRSSEDAFESPPSQPLRAPEDAKSLLQRALDQSADQPTVSGRRLRLREALERSSVRTEQIATVKSYWRLAVAEADFNHALDELNLLFSLPDPDTPHERKQLAAAQHAAKARRAEAELALMATRHELATSDSSLLPLAGDAPLVGAYKTRFDQMFSGRTAPVELRRLAQSLPLYHSLLDARAVSVTSAEDALIELADAYPRDFSYGEIIDAFLRLRDQRIAFLVTVRDYNNAIADYSLNTIGSGLSLDAVVATLIETPAASSVLISSGSVRPASGEQPIRTAGQPTPATRPLVPVAQPNQGSVPRQVFPSEAAESAPPATIPPITTVPAQISPEVRQQLTPEIPAQAPNGFDFQR